MEKESGKAKRQECYQKDEFCENRECEEYINWMETGNCAKRFDREHTLEEVGMAFGITRERARQLIDTALKRAWYRSPSSDKEKKFRSHLPFDFKVLQH